MLKCKPNIFFNILKNIISNYNIVKNVTLNEV